MELDYFEIEINGRIHPVAKHEFSQYDKSVGKTGFSISIWDSNIEAAKQVIIEHEVKHIKVSTSNLEFLKNQEFLNINGLEVHGEIKDIRPIENLSELKFLTILNERKGKLDFSKLGTLELLHCDYSNNYKNLSSLVNLRDLYLRKYSRSDLQELRTLNKLKELHLLFAKCKTLEGIESMSKLEKLTLDECKYLVSLDGLETINSLIKLLVVDCKSLNDYSIANRIGNNCIALVDGMKIREIVSSDKDALDKLIDKFNELGTSPKLIESIHREILKLKEINGENWKEILTICIKSLNELSVKHEGIYTEEREEIISTIEHLLIDFDDDEIEKIIDENRIW